MAFLTGRGPRIRVPGGGISKIDNWTDWTPDWFVNGTPYLGGTLDGSYIIQTTADDSHLIHLVLQATVGAGLPAGTWAFNAPLHSVWHSQGAGGAFMERSGGGGPFQIGVVALSNGDFGGIGILCVDGSIVDDTHPWAWASGDILTWSMYLRQF